MAIRVPVGLTLKNAKAGIVDSILMASRSSRAKDAVSDLRSCLEKKLQPPSGRLASFTFGNWEFLGKRRLWID
jgi:hypothetical protein